MNREREFQDTREHLLATGEAVIRGKGFAAVGLAEILAEAGVPKGSFYHYFRSKEGFGADMLERYFQRYDQDLKAILLQRPSSGRERLLGYFRLWLSRHEGESCAQGCLAVKLSAEVADLSEAMREVLVDGMQRVELRLSQAIRAGQEDGSLSPELDAAGMAASLYQLWVGAELLAKVQRSAQPLSRAYGQTEVWLQAAE